VSGMRYVFDPARPAGSRITLYDSSSSFSRFETKRFVDFRFVLFRTTIIVCFDLVSFFWLRHVSLLV
jgi:hypothetical protein